MKAKIKLMVFFVLILFLAEKGLCMTWDYMKRITYMSGSSSCPKIVADSNNVIHIIWEENTSGCPQVYYKNCTAGGTGVWSPPYRITYNSRYSSEANMTYNGSPYRLRLVYTEHIPGNTEIYFKRGNN